MIRYSERTCALTSHHGVGRSVDTVEDDEACSIPLVLCPALHSLPIAYIPASKLLETLAIFLIARLRRTRDVKWPHGLHCGSQLVSCLALRTGCLSTRDGPIDVLMGAGNFFPRKPAIV